MTDSQETAGGFIGWIHFGDLHIQNAEDANYQDSSDEISILVNQAGRYHPPLRKEIDYENAIGRYPGKGILGTEPGPNEKGTKGPWPSWRTK